MEHTKSTGSRNPKGRSKNPKRDFLLRWRRAVAAQMVYTEGSGAAPPRIVRMFTPAQTAVLHLLATFARMDGTETTAALCWLAEARGVSRQTAYRAISKARLVGLLDYRDETTIEGKWDTHRYRFLIPIGGGSVDAPRYRMVGGKAVEIGADPGDQNRVTKSRTIEGDYRPPQGRESPPSGEIADRDRLELELAALNGQRRAIIARLEVTSRPEIDPPPSPGAAPLPADPEAYTPVSPKRARALAESAIGRMKATTKTVTEGQRAEGRGEPRALTYWQRYATVTDKDGTVRDARTGEPL